MNSSNDTHPPTVAISLEYAKLQSKLDPLLNEMLTLVCTAKKKGCDKSMSQLLQESMLLKAKLITMTIEYSG